MANMYGMDNYTHVDPAIYYSDTNIPGPGVEPGLWEVSLCVQCTCVDECGTTCACLEASGGQNYINHLLSDEKLSASSFLLECNDLCKCSTNCGNRVVQLGPRRSLSTFLTSLRGYGLKTTSHVQRGSFICEYAGEVISREEARRRALHDGVNYIFVLKEHTSNSVSETIIDPTCIGNIGRYVNHSCQPNAAVVPVYIDCPVPKLAIFALSDIKPDEEITYDYASGSAEIGTSPCFCQTKSCRNFLPFNKDLLC
uniref:SET domain-containing protein n=1 Tax=Homalodisca liturata TaxID=320908 RepID=A0A1B6IPN4_9HEMI